jgi:hypothetical protein
MLTAKIPPWQSLCPVSGHSDCSEIKKPEEEIFIMLLAQFVRLCGVNPYISINPYMQGS